MVKILFFIMCSFILSPTTPAPEASQYRPFNNAIKALTNIDVAEELTKMFFKYPEQASANVIELMNTKNNPKVSDVLDAFNKPFDISLFVIRNDNIQLNIKAFEIVLFRNYREFINQANPFNFNHIKQSEETFLKFKQEIKLVSDAVSEAENKLPVERLVATLNAQSRATGIQQRWALNHRCKYFVNSATETIQNSISEASEALTVLPFTENQNVVIMDAGVGLLKDFLLYAHDIVLLTTNTCNATRKRREVNDEIEFKGHVTTRGAISIIEDLMGLISSCMNTILMSILESIRRSVEKVFEIILDVIVYLENIVVAVYPCAFCKT